LGRDVDDLFTVGQQPVGDVLADAGAALDRPDPVRPLPTRETHRGVAVPVGAEPAAVQDRLVAGHHLDRCRALVRVHPDDHAIRNGAHEVLRCSIPFWLTSREGTAASTATNPSLASPGP